MQVQQALKNQDLQCLNLVTNWLIHVGAAFLVTGSFRFIVRFTISCGSSMTVLSTSLSFQSQSSSITSCNADISSILCYCVFIFIYHVQCKVMELFVGSFAKVYIVYNFIEQYITLIWVYNSK